MRSSNLIAVKITALLLLITSSLAYCQEKAKPSKVRVALIQKVEDKPLFIITKNGSIPITASSYNLSPVYEIPVNTPAYIYSKEPAAELTPQQLKAGALANILIPADHQKAILLFYLSPKQDKLKTYLINGNDTKFKWGSRLIFNLSSKTVAIKYGKTKVVTRPTKRSYIKAKSATNGDFILVKGVYEDKERMRTFLSSRWINDDKSRSIIFVYDQSHSSAPTFHGIEETKLPIKK